MAGAQQPNASVAAAGLGGNFIAMARAYDAVAWNPAMLGLSGNPRFSLTIAPFGGTASLSPIDLKDINTYSDKTLPTTVRRSWLDRVTANNSILARNVAGYPFLTKCTRHQRQALESKVRETILGARISNETLYVDLEASPELDRQLLVERHLISRPHAAAEGARGVAVGDSENVSIMVNEEDHLRLQVLRSGLQLEEVARRFDFDKVERALAKPPKQ